MFRLWFYILILIYNSIKSNPLNKILSKKSSFSIDYILEDFPSLGNFNFMFYPSALCFFFIVFPKALSLALKCSATGLSFFEVTATPPSHQAKMPPLRIQVTLGIQVTLFQDSLVDTLNSCLFAFLFIRFFPSNRSDSIIHSGSIPLN